MSVFISKQLTVPSLGKALSDYAVGESVFIPVNGVQTEFLVVNQGIPSSVYDGSCDGTWLLMKDVYEKRVWNNADGDYAKSSIHTYLNGTFLNLFDATIQSVIKQVKIPYGAGTGTSTTIKSGANGLSTKVFLLSYKEMDFSGYSNVSAEGSVLSYFKGATNAKRIAYLNGTAVSWWLRSQFINKNKYGCYINPQGAAFEYGGLFTNSLGIRPCIILPYDTLFNPKTNEVKA